jgi:hypothetical protein
MVTSLADERSRADADVRSDDERDACAGAESSGVENQLRPTMTTAAETGTGGGRKRRRSDLPVKKFVITSDASSAAAALSTENVEHVPKKKWNPRPAEHDESSVGEPADAAQDLTVVCGDAGQGGEFHSTRTMKFSGKLWQGSSKTVFCSSLMK